MDVLVADEVAEPPEDINDDGLWEGAGTDHKETLLYRAIKGGRGTRVNAQVRYKPPGGFELNFQCTDLGEKKSPRNQAYM